MPSRRPAEHGQASVELVALLPLLAILAAFAWQAVVAGQTVWLAGTAARAAARAHALGRDPRAAARAALPVPRRHDVRVRAEEDGRVVVRLAIPLVGMRRSALGSVDRTVRFAPQGAS